MLLSYRLTRQNPGMRRPVLNGSTEFNDPLLKAASLRMSFRQDTVVGYKNYRFSGNVTLSFMDRQLNAEHFDFQGVIASFPGTMLCYGCVTYTSGLQGSTPMIKGLICRFIGRMELPGPTFHPFPPQPADMDLQLIQPTPQQQQINGMLFVKGYRLVETAAALIIAQESWP